MVIRNESQLACRSWESKSAEEIEGLERNWAAEGKEASEVAGEAGRNQVQFTSESGDEWGGEAAVTIPKWSWNGLSDLGGEKILGSEERLPPLGHCPQLQSRSLLTTIISYPGLGRRIICAAAEAPERVYATYLSSLL